MQDPTRHELPNEKELLLQVASGSEAAFRAVVVFYRPYLFSYILTFTRSREKAEETVQDVFLQVWLSRETLRQVQDFRSFLFVISKHKALNAVRSMLRETARKSKWLQSNNEEWVAAPLDIPEETPGLLDLAVASLPEQQQKAWLLVRKEGRSYVEAAAVMGISRETIKKYLRYATGSITRFISNRMRLLSLLLAVVLALLKKS